MKSPETTPNISKVNIDVVALDWDGTVVNSVPYKLKQNQAIAAEFGKQLSVDEVRIIWNRAQGFPDLMKLLTGSDDMEAIMEVVHRDYDNPDYAKREFPFAKEALRSIRELGFRLALLTSATREILELDEQTLDLKCADYFDYVQTADDSEYKKPDGRVFVPLVNAMNVEPGRVVYIGDEMKDGLAARSADVNFIGVQTGMASQDEFTVQDFASTDNLSTILLR
jgi:HAD superfamily hydrolase (TIGR01549 family)